MRVEGVGDAELVAYEKLDELYFALGRAIAQRHGPMSAPELRFLRKRLNLTQAEVAALGDKSVQAAAKWEKAQLPVPRAEASLIRLKWLQAFAPGDVVGALQAVGVQTDEGSHCLVFVFHYRKSLGWVHDKQTAQDLSNR